MTLRTTFSIGLGACDLRLICAEKEDNYVHCISQKERMTGSEIVKHRERN